MPLSEHEQRLFEQIERSLSEDAKFASAVRHNDPKFLTKRRLILAALAILAGLALLIYGTVAKLAWVGVIGFVVMLGAAAVAVLARGRSGSAQLRAVDGTASRSTGRGSNARPGLIDRLEQRWRNRGGYN